MKLSHLDTPQLVALAADIAARPESQSPAGSFWKYVPRARKQLDLIALEITHRLADARKAAGRPVPCDGYSGRQSNK